MNRKEYIGQRIYKARTKKRLSQKRVAEITNINKNLIRKIEHGMINVPLYIIEQLCDVVGANIRIFEGSKIFENLRFEKHPFHILAEQIGESYPNYESDKTCFQAQMDFANGLHISVVIGTPFLSNGVDTYEVCLWSENGYKEILGHLSDMEISTLMEYAQIIKDIRILDCLKENGFEIYNGFGTPLTYIKQYEDWYIHINPCGNPIISSSKEFHNFRNIICYEDFDEIEGIIKNLSVYVKYCDSNE